MSSFTQKDLRFVIDIPDKGVLDIRGLRASVNIDKAGGVMLGQASIKIFNASDDVAAKATQLRYQIDGLYRKIKIDVFAIDGNNESRVFSGDVVFSVANYQSSPDISLDIIAITGKFALIKPVPPRTFFGTVDLSSIFGTIADSANLAFENNGVTKKVSNLYLPGTDIQQARRLAANYGIDLYIDDEVMAICPKGAPREGTPVLLSPESGLIGYPQVSDLGVIVRSVFNPTLRFGGKVKVSGSKLDMANKEWYVSNMSLTLDANLPGGAWESTLNLTQAQFAIIR